MYVDGDIKVFMCTFSKKVNVSPVPKHQILLHSVPLAYHKSLVEPHRCSQEEVLINRDSNTGRHSYHVDWYTL